VATSPRVSVLVTNYNYARYLTQAIDSALAQSYRDTEIVVVDDGSTDNSLEVIAAYGSKVRLVAKENGGQGSAFNAGFLESRGDIICFLDADDTWSTDKIAAVVAAADAAPEAVLFYHRIVSMDAERKTFGPSRPAKLLRGQIASDVERAGGYWPCPPTSAISCRRSLLSTLLPMDERSWRLCADAYLADLAPFFGAIVGIDETLAQYRVHESNNWVPSAAALADPRLFTKRLDFLASRYSRLSDSLRRLKNRSVELNRNHQLQYLLARRGDLMAWLRLTGMAVTGTPFVTRGDAMRAPGSAAYRFLLARLSASRT
jgi:glycosyltransferase involved in cell wall biosynthesis